VTKNDGVSTVAVSLVYPCFEIMVLLSHFRRVISLAIMACHRLSLPAITHHSCTFSHRESFGFHKNALTNGLLFFAKNGRTRVPPVRHTVTMTRDK